MKGRRSKVQFIHLSTNISIWKVRNLNREFELQAVFDGCDPPNWFWFCANSDYWERCDLLKTNAVLLSEIDQFALAFQAIGHSAHWYQTFDLALSGSCGAFHNVFFFCKFCLTSFTAEARPQSFTSLPTSQVCFAIQFARPRCGNSLRPHALVTVYNVIMEPQTQHLTLFVSSSLQTAQFRFLWSMNTYGGSSSHTVVMVTMTTLKKTLTQTQSFPSQSETWFCPVPVNH